MFPPISVASAVAAAHVAGAAHASVSFLLPHIGVPRAQAPPVQPQHPELKDQGRIIPAGTKPNHTNTQA